MMHETAYYRWSFTGSRVMNQWRYKKLQLRKAVGKGSLLCRCWRISPLWSGWNKFSMSPSHMKTAWSAKTEISCVKIVYILFGLVLEKFEFMHPAPRASMRSFLFHLVSFHEFWMQNLVAPSVKNSKFCCLKSANLLQQSQTQSSLLIIIKARAGRKFLCVGCFLKRRART